MVQALVLGFFFQAEDGIRHHCVTGVQTCALPISLGAQFDFLSENPDLVTLLTQAGRSDARPFAPAINRLVVLFAEGQGHGQVRDDLDPHLAAAQALMLMVSYLGLESLIAVSAPPLGADEPALRERWKDAAVRLVLAGVATRPTSPTS